MYYYVAANKVLFNKNIMHHINVVTKAPRTLKENNLANIYVCNVITKHFQNV